MFLLIVHMWDKLMTHSEPALTPPECSVDRVAHRVPTVVQSFVCLFVCLFAALLEGRHLNGGCFLNHWTPNTLNRSTDMHTLTHTHAQAFKNLRRSISLLRTMVTEQTSHKTIVNGQVQILTRTEHMILWTPNFWTVVYAFLCLLGYQAVKLATC